MNRFKSIAVIDKVDRVTFENEIRPLNQPVVMKGLVSHWPCVEAAKKSSEALGAYLKKHDSRRTSLVSVCPAEFKGRFFYNESLTGVNFTAINESISGLVDWFLAQPASQCGEARYIQALPIPAVAPDMMAGLNMPLLNTDVQPRLWLGNTICTQTHLDRPENIACHVAGKKVFTLFPPDQLPNLYMGPLDMTPGGALISLASLDEPDFNAHPRFAQALEVAQQAHLEPGDALYIPSYWWHHVQTTGPLNMLVNYWWNDARPDAYHPLATLYLAALSIKHLPSDQRQFWKTMLDYYIFDSAGDPVAHLPASIQGAFSQEISAEKMQLSKRQFKQRFQQMFNQ
jgi:hypothetical protein